MRCLLLVQRMEQVQTIKLSPRHSCMNMAWFYLHFNEYCGVVWGYGVIPSRLLGNGEKYRRLATLDYFAEEDFYFSFSTAPIRVFQ